MKNRLIIAVAIATSTLTAACSSGPDLSAQAADGREIARTSGCQACHGENGEGGPGGIGPPWAGLLGEEVELEDGRVVVADEAYIRNSIRNPQDDIVAGYTVVMPPNQLTDTQIDSLIAYISELS